MCGYVIVSGAIPLLLLADGGPGQEFVDGGARE